MEDLEEPKPDPKGKATASFILAIISLLPYLLFVIYTIMANNIPALSGSNYLVVVVMASFIFTLIAAPIGIILGVQALKSTKRKTAIFAIILAIIAFLPVLFDLGSFLIIAAILPKH